MPRDVPLSMLFERSQSYWNGLLLLLTFSPLALLWSRRRSVLDLWLMVVMCGLLIELCLITLVGLRYVVGWYAARVYSFPRRSCWPCCFPKPLCSTHDSPAP